MSDEFDESKPPLSEVSIYGDPGDFMKGFARLSERQQAFFATQWCSSEVCNGGLHQFFGNPTGVLAPEALAGFRRAGASELAAILERALSWFGADYPRDWGHRAELLENHLTEWRASHPGVDVVDHRDDWDPFHALDEEFRAALDEDTALARYLYGDTSR